MACLSESSPARPIDGGAYPTKSEPVSRIVRRMVREGVSNAAIYAALPDLPKETVGNAIWAARRMAGVQGPPAQRPASRREIIMRMIAEGKRNEEIYACFPNVSRSCMSSDVSRYRKMAGSDQKTAESPAMRAIGYHGSYPIVETRWDGEPLLEVCPGHLVPARDLSAWGL